jgi:hypothetical protein
LGAREGGEELGSVRSRPDLELAAAAINGAGGRLGPGQGAAERGAGWLGFNEEEVGTCGRVKDTRLYSRYSGDIDPSARTGEHS